MVASGGPGGLHLRLHNSVSALHRHVAAFSASKKIRRGNSSPLTHLVSATVASGAVVAAAAAGGVSSRRAAAPPCLCQRATLSGCCFDRSVKSKAFLQDFGNSNRRGTNIMLSVNMLCFVLQKLSKDIITVYGAKVNMYTLHSVGPHLEELGGQRRFFAVYTAAQLGGTCLSCIYAPNVMSVGSSCAIFGLFGGVAVYYWRHRLLLRQRSRRVFNALGVTLVMNLLLALAIRRLDHWGHAGGLLAGAAAGWLLGPRLAPYEQSGKAQGWYEDKPPLPVLAFEGPRNTL